MHPLHRLPSCVPRPVPSNIAGRGNLLSASPHPTLSVVARVPALASADGATVCAIQCRLETGKLRRALLLGLRDRCPCSSRGLGARALPAPPSRAARPPAARARVLRTPRVVPELASCGTNHERSEPAGQHSAKAIVHGHGFAVGAPRSTVLDPSSTIASVEKRSFARACPPVAAPGIHPLPPGRSSNPLAAPGLAADRGWGGRRGNAAGATAARVPYRLRARPKIRENSHKMHVKSTLCFHCPKRRRRQVLHTSLAPTGRKSSSGVLSCPHQSSTSTRPESGRVCFIRTTCRTEPLRNMAKVPGSSAGGSGMIRGESRFFFGGMFIPPRSVRRAAERSRVRRR